MFGYWALGFGGRISELTGYTADLCTGGTALKSSEDAPNNADTAFVDDGATTFWRSNDSGGAVNGTSYIGYDFGSAKSIRQFTVMNGRVGSAGWGATSVIFRYSDDGTSWTNEGTYAVTDDESASTQSKQTSDAGAHRYWSILLNSAIATRWQVSEMEMMEGVFS